jgi:hypothetical protein
MLLVGCEEMLKWGEVQAFCCVTKRETLLIRTSLHLHIGTSSQIS